jgi:hypothetical protein
VNWGNYENKSVDGSQAFHLRTWGPSIKVTYSFEVLESSHWGKSWRYSPRGGAESNKLESDA